MTSLWRVAGEPQFYQLASSANLFRLAHLNIVIIEASNMSTFEFVGLKPGLVLAGGLLETT